MSDDIIFFDATRLAELIRTKAVSPVEVVQKHLDRIEATNPAINAIVTIAGGAIAAATAAEKAVLAGDDIGPLHGVPFGFEASGGYERKLAILLDRLDLGFGLRRACVTTLWLGRWLALIALECRPPHRTGCAHTEPRRGRPA